MAKTCIVNKNKEGKIESVLVRDPNQIVEDGLINFAISKNNGHSLDKAPNGKESILYKTYVDELGLSDKEAMIEVAKVYTDDFKNWFGDWQNDPENASKVVDLNGQPKIVWSGQHKDVDKYEGYDNKEYSKELNKWFIPKTAFFIEDKPTADTYAKPMLGLTAEQEIRHFGKVRESNPLFLNIRNPQKVVENSYRAIPDIKDESDGLVGGLYRGSQEADDKIVTWSIRNGNQVIPPSSIDINEDYNEYKEKTKYINSKLYEELKQLPFITDEQALDIYKNIYKSNMNYWLDPNNNENVNRDTKEPIIYYKGDNSKIYDNLVEVIKNSSNSFSIGFMNNEKEFESFVEHPIYNETTVKGKIQKYIKNQYILPTSENDIYQTENSIASEMVERDLALSGMDYKRDGNTFEIKQYDYDYDLKSLQNKIGKGAGLRAFAANYWIDDLTSAPKPKDTIYSKETLYNLLQSFMQKAGITVTSIEEYKKKYEAKFGIEPDAKAFIDIWSKIVAFKNGEITLDGLTEEVSHFIIEAWNQNEIKRLLPYVKNTSYYAQFAEMYREIYSKQTSDPDVLEEYVQKEILGKMLAESLQKDFTVENKTEIEKNFFQKLSDILAKFFDYISSKITKKETDEIKLFSEQIKNLLYNEKLYEELENPNPQSKIQIMYSVEEDVLKQLNKFGINIAENLSDNVKDEMFIKGVHDILREQTIIASSLIKDMKTKKLTPDLLLSIENIINLEEDISNLVRYANYNLKTNSKFIEKLKNVNELSNLTFSNIRELKYEFNNTFKNKSKKGIVNSILNFIGEGDTFYRQESTKGIEDIQKDVNFFTKVFGHVGKLPNRFADLLSNIIKRMHNKTMLETYSDIKKYLIESGLYENRNKLKNFIKGGSYKTIVDIDSKYKFEKEYEYEIRVKIEDPIVKDITIDDFIKNYNNIDEIDKSSSLYYKYQYEYEKGYSKQKFASSKRSKHYDDKIKFLEEIVVDKSDLDNGISILYTFLKNLENKRQDPSLSVISRREASNIFNRDGSLKKGLEYMRYSQFLNLEKMGYQMVNINNGSELKQNDFVLVFTGKGKGREEGQLAFELIKWNRRLILDDKNIQYDAFKDDFDNTLNFLNKKNNKRFKYINENLKEWFKKNVQIEVSELKTVGINYDNLLKVLPEKQKQEVLTIENDLQKLSKQRNELLKIYRDAYDYREINSDNIPSDDKLLIFNIEIEISKLKNQLSQFFRDNDMDMYDAESDSVIEFNNSFYNLFEKEMGVKFENATFNQKKNFFSGQNGMSAEQYSNFLNFSKMLDKGNISITSNSYRQIEKYKKIAKDPNSKDSIKEAYLKQNAPSWYKRYDPNIEYSNFMRDVQNGAVNMEILIKNYIKSGYKKLEYNGKTLEGITVQPSFRYSYITTKPMEQLKKEYDDLEDKKDKFNKLLEMGNLSDLENMPKEDMKDILDNPENLDLYIKMMDLHLTLLEKYDLLKPNYIFMRPQVRQSSMERFNNFLTSKNKLSEFKKATAEKFMYREDDQIDAYKTKRIPKMGMIKVDENDITDDLFGSLAWAINEANLYQNRVDSFSYAKSALYALESQSFEKNKKAIDTNIHKVMEEMIDYNFYNKTTTMKIEYDVFGKKVDLGKVAMTFKNFGITQALALSPIVATTNFTSGLTSYSFLKWTGKSIYSPSANRADMLIAPLLGDSVRDIGKINFETKMNKILYNFGLYDIKDRFQNTQYNNMLRLIPEVNFSLMAITNYPLQSKVALSKLMEVRLINGEFTTWRNYLLKEKSKNQTKTEKEIKQEFEKYSKNSMYDYLDENSEFDSKKLKEDGYKGNIENDKLNIISKIQDISEQTIMEMRKHNEGFGARDPRLSFVLSLKKWLIMAYSKMFLGKRLDKESGGYEEGLIFTPSYILEIIRKMRNENLKLSEAYSQMDEYQKKNFKESSIITAGTIMMLVVAMFLKKMADDDDEKDNYGLQLANYMMLRNLNETFSGNIGIGNSIYESLQSPIMMVNTLGNISKLGNLSDIGETVDRGKFEGENKYVANLIKLTAIKNLYTLKDADAIYETRKGYEHFTTENAFYHILNYLPKKEDSGN